MSADGAPMFGVPGVGARIGRHLIEGVLGRGGMGVVLAARHETLGDRAAIKVLTANAWGTAEAEARFVREAQICAQLKSDHALRVFDVGRLDDGSKAPYLVMEYLAGKNLEELVLPKGAPPRPLGVMEVADTILEACEVLAEAHAQGVVHRDIKPSNLFLTKRPDGSPLLKVLDFGIAKRVETGANLTATSAVIGTPNFMSPEQLRATRDVDLRSDVWSLGATMYALLTAKAPFEGASAAETTVNVLTAAPIPVCVRRRELPPELDRIVLTCLEKDPAHRYPSARALADALVAFASPRGRTAHTTLHRRAFGAGANPLAATAYAGTVRLGDVLASGDKHFAAALGNLPPARVSPPAHSAPPPGTAPPTTGAPYNYREGTRPNADFVANATGNGGWAPTGAVPPPPTSNGLFLGGAIAAIGLVAAGIVLAVVVHFQRSAAALPPLPSAAANHGSLETAPIEPPPLAPLASERKTEPPRAPEKPSAKAGEKPQVAPSATAVPLPVVQASSLPKAPPPKPKADGLFDSNDSNN